MTKTFQIFDSQSHILLDTRDFLKAVRLAKSTRNSLIKVKWSAFTNSQVEHFEFSFASPGENTSDDSIRAYIDLRVDDEMQNLREKSEGDRENDASFRKSGRI